VVLRLGDIPVASQTLTAHGLEFEIVSMKGRTVDRVRARSRSDTFADATVR
jgi:CBS domain containing-hemolysin-like protein